MKFYPFISFSQDVLCFANGANIATGFFRSRDWPTEAIGFTRISIRKATPRSSTPDAIGKRKMSKLRKVLFVPWANFITDGRPRNRICSAPKQALWSPFSITWTLNITSAAASASKTRSASSSSNTCHRPFRANTTQSCWTGAPVQ